MTESPAAVTPIFDQLVAEFGRRNRTAEDTREHGPAARAGTPEEPTAEENQPGATV
jgi:hypothetical protein